MTDFALLQFPKLFSRKIWMIEKCWIFHTVYSTTFKLFYFFDSVERRLGQELFTMKTSPSNGKARLQSSFLYVTASLGEESHLFIKSNDRRIHHSRKVNLSQCSQIFLTTQCVNFIITQILREINICDSRSAKFAILTHLEALNCDLMNFCTFLKAGTYQINLFQIP